MVAPEVLIVLVLVSVVSGFVTTFMAMLRLRRQGRPIPALLGWASAFSGVAMVVLLAIVLFLVVASSFSGWADEQTASCSAQTSSCPG